MRTLFLFVAIAGCAASNESMRKTNEWGEPIVSTSKVERHSSDYVVDVERSTQSGTQAFTFRYAYTACWYEFDDLVEQEQQLPDTYIQAPYVGTVPVHHTKKVVVHRPRSMREQFKCPLAPLAHVKLEIDVDGARKELSRLTDSAGKISINDDDIPPSACYGNHHTVFLVNDRYQARSPLSAPHCSDVEDEEYETLVQSDITAVKAFVEHFPQSDHVAELKGLITAFDQKQAEEKRVQEIANAKRAAAEKAEQERTERHEQQRQSRLDAEAKERAKELRERREQEQKERDRQYASSCGDTPKIDSWHGIPIAAYRYLKDNMNDDDFDVIGCSVPVLSERRCWASACKIRGKNAFGAKVLNVIQFYIRADTVLSAKTVD